MAPAQAPLPRRAFLKGAAATAGALTLGGPVLLSRPAKASVGNGVHLAYGADPASQVGVSWSTPPGVSSELLQVLRNGDWAPVAAQARTSAAIDTVYRHALVEGLTPDTSYDYRIGEQGIVRSFRTAPLQGRSFRFAMFGDMGVSQGAVDNLAQLHAADPELCFVAGDLCYADLSGGLAPLTALPYNPAIWDNWLAQIESSASKIPWMSTVGNHEMERDNELGYDNYLAKFQLPANGASGGPVTYHFRYGNVAFVAADGNDVSAEITRNNGYLPTQDQWLRNTLGTYRADATIDFIVVGFHNCMYCTNALHGSDGGNRSRWESIFDEFGVDVVVNGHNHSYERTHPIRNGVPTVEAPAGSTVSAALGTTYLTAGGAGQAEYPTTTHPTGFVVIEGGARIPELATWSAVRYGAHSIVLADVNGSEMTLTAVAKTGAVVDTVNLTRP